jgi:hypothetical protein
MFSTSTTFQGVFMRQSTARRLLAASAICIATMSSAHADIDPATTSLSGIACSNSGVLTFTGGPQTSLQCSTVLVFNSGQLEASESIRIQADEGIQILGPFAFLAPHVSLTSKTIQITGTLTGLGNTNLVIDTTEGGLGPIAGGTIGSGVTISIREPAGAAVPEPSAALMVLLGLLSVLGWKAAHKRTLPVRACQSITQSPMKL